MRWAIALMALAAACGPAPAASNQAADRATINAPRPVMAAGVTPDEVQQMDAIRSGDGRSWRAASAGARNAYSRMNASIMLDNMQPGLGEVTETQPARDDIAARLSDCMDLGARSRASATMVDLSYDCMQQQLPRVRSMVAQAQQRQ